MKLRWKNNKHQWGLISILIHWCTAITIIGLFISGLWMTGLDYYSKWYQLAPFIHKSVGITLFVMTLFRLIWRLTMPHPAPLQSHTKTEIILASLMHVGLYTILFLIMIAGYLISTADGRAISWFNVIEIPATVTNIPKQEDLAGLIHLYLAYMVIIMASLHAIAAIKHHIVNKDQTLNRMLGRKMNQQMNRNYDEKDSSL